jgi:hypothetical protein
MGKLVSKWYQVIAHPLERMEYDMSKYIYVSTANAWYRILPQSCRRTSVFAVYHEEGWPRGGIQDDGCAGKGHDFYLIVKVR